MRLIDADALKIRLGRAYSLDKRRIMEIAKETINIAPTIDAVEVVRCKDCLNSWVMPKEMQNVGEYRCEFWYAEMHGDDYCSCGKRREDE